MVSYKTYPLIVLLGLLTLFTVVFGYAVQLYERDIGVLQIKGNLNFTDVFNSIWIVFEGMTTIGFGDLVPKTNIGRMLLVLACFVGIFVLTLLIISIQTMINPSPNQLEALYLI